jgi:hypothetical protein
MTAVKIRAQIDDLKAKIVLRIDSNLTTRFSSSKCDFFAFELFGQSQQKTLVTIISYCFLLVIA